MWCYFSVQHSIHISKYWFCKTLQLQFSKWYPFTTLLSFLTCIYLGKFHWKPGYLLQERPDHNLLIKHKSFKRATLKSHFQNTTLSACNQFFFSNGSDVASEKNCSSLYSVHNYLNPSPLSALPGSLPLQIQSNCPGTKQWPRYFETGPCGWRQENKLIVHDSSCLT